MRMFNQKQICLMSQGTNPSPKVVRRQQERELDISQTVLFESNAPAIFSSYEKWKDIPQCYFIKLRYHSVEGFCPRISSLFILSQAMSANESEVDATVTYAWTMSCMEVLDPSKKDLTCEAASGSSPTCPDM